MLRDEPKMLFPAVKVFSVSVKKVYYIVGYTVSNLYSLLKGSYRIVLDASNNAEKDRK